MRNLFLVIIVYLVIIPSECIGQNNNDLIVEYDLYTNDVVYLKGGNKMISPTISENSNIYVVIKEYNPYIMKASVIVEESGYQQNSMQYSGDLGEYQGSGGFGGISNLLGGLNMGADITNMFSGIPGSRGQTDINVVETKNEFKMLSQSLAEVEGKINNASLKINKIKKIDSSRKIAFNDIESLRINEKIRPSRIKELMIEEINYAFAKNKGESITIEDMIDDSKIETDLVTAVDQYNKASDEYKSLAKRWSSFTNTLSIFSGDSEDMQLNFILTASDSLVKSMNNTIEQKLKSSVETNALPRSTSQDVLKLADLRQVYEELQDDIFTFRFPPVQAEGNEMKILVIVSKKEKNDDYREYKRLQQKIPVLGGWRISAGLGITFGTLFNKSYDYSIINNVIVADEKDEFIPSITSFAHAYKQSANNVNFGGSFGIGFPIVGGGGLQDINFYLGPTLILGKNQKFLVTCGLMGGKSSSLTGGFKEGDEYINIFNDIPVKQRYGLGYFLGISYDLLK